MKIFDHPNIDADWKCPICYTNTDKPVILIGIHGTEYGRNIESKQIHIDCIELTMVDVIDGTMLIQQFKHRG